VLRVVVHVVGVGLRLFLHGVDVREECVGAKLRGIACPGAVARDVGVEDVVGVHVGAHGVHELCRIEAVVNLGVAVCKGHHATPGAHGGHDLTGTGDGRIGTLGDVDEGFVAVLRATRGHQREVRTALTVPIVTASFAGQRNEGVRVVAPGVAGSVITFEVVTELRIPARNAQGVDIGTNGRLARRGADNELVLSTVLGLTESEIDLLKEAGVLLSASGP